MPLQNPEKNARDFLVCIVLYKQILKETSTYKSLIAAANGLSDLTVFIYDNSPSSQSMEGESMQTEAPDITYIYEHDKLNSGISKAYNKAAEIGEKLKKTWLIFFDQDTNINTFFFDKMITAIKNSPLISLVVPINKAHKIISPSLFVFGRSFIKKNIKTGMQPVENLSVINSGLAVKIQALKEVGGYNELLPLDFSDHYFMFCFKKKYNYFFVLDCVNEHNLSTFSDRDFHKVNSRFTVYFKSAIYFSKVTKSSLPIYWALLRALKISVQNRNFNFIKQAVRQLRNS